VRQHGRSAQLKLVASEVCDLILFHHFSGKKHCWHGFATLSCFITFLEKAITIAIFQTTAYVERAFWLSGPDVVGIPQALAEERKGRQRPPLFSRGGAL
jgi:hypothetical protein